MKLHTLQEYATYNDLVLQFGAEANNLQTHIAKKLQPILNTLFDKDINMTLRYAKLAPESGCDFVEGLYK